MSWPAARLQLQAALQAVDEIDEVYLAPPASGAALAVGTSVYVAPPGRTSERTPSGRTVTDLDVRLVVLRALTGDPERVSLAVDDAVDAVDAAMEGHITLGGTATSTSAVSWEPALEEEYPAGSGVWYLAASGTLRVKFVRDHERSP